MESILILGKYATTEKEGFETRTTELAYQFVKNGYSTTIVTSNSNHLASFPKFDKIFNYKKYKQVDFWWIKGIQYKGSGSWKRIISWIDFEIKSILLLYRLKKHDVIIATSLSLLSILTGILYKKIWKVKLIFEVRDIWPLTLIEDGKYSRLNPLIIFLSLIERVGYRYSDYIIGTMPNLKKHVANVVGKNHSNKVGCIPFGIHLNESNIDKTRPPNEIKDIEGKFKIGYAGSIGISNALDNFIEAIRLIEKIHSHMHFYILGDGALLNKYRLELQDSENITFTGRIERSLVHSYLENMDVLFFSAQPNKIWEYGWSPNKLIDYMRAKKPIIAAYDGYKSILNEAGCGIFIKAGCTNSILSALIKMYELPSHERRTMGDKGYDWIIKEREWSIIGKEYLKIINNVLS